MRERIAFLNSLTTLPVEVEVTRKSGNRKRTSNQVLDLVPYLETLVVAEDGTVNFTLRRLAPAGKPNSRHQLDGKTDGVEPGNYDNTQHDTREDSRENAGVRAEIDAAETIPASVKPSWVLDLIDSTLKWSLTRTELVMEPVKETLSGTGAKA